MKELLLVSPLPSSPSLSATPHKNLTLPLTVPNLPSPSRVAQFLPSQLKCSVEGWAFSRLKIVPFSACLSLWPMGAMSTSLPDSQSTCYIASDKNLSAEASYFLSGDYWPHLTPFSTFWKWEEWRKQMSLSLSYMPHLFSHFSHLVGSFHASLQGWSSAYPFLCFYMSHFHGIQFRNI